MEDHVLVTQLQRGQNGAATELVRRYEKFAFAVAMQAMGNYHDAEEVASEAMVKALTKISSFQGQASFKSWLYRIVYNTAMTHLRKRKPSQVVEEHHLPVSEENDQQNQEQREEMLRRAIADLKPDDRLMITMYYFDKRSVEEVAKAMDLTLSNAKVKLHRIRGRLKEKLEDKIWTL